MDKFEIGESTKNEGSKVENIEMEKSLDQKWFDELSKFPDTEIFKWLEGDAQYRSQMKEDFFKALDENNVDFLKSDKFKLDYPKTLNSNIDFKQEIDKLLELKKKINKEESDELIRDLYNAKIDEKTAEFGMLLAIKEGNDKEFFENCEEVYGEPNKDFFDATMAEALEKIKKYKDSDDPEKRKLYERFISNFDSKYINECEDQKTQSVKPVWDIKDLALIGQQSAQSAAMDIIGLFYKIPDIYKVDAIKKDFENYFEQIGINTPDTPEEKKWKVIFANKSSFSVDQEKRELSVPIFSKEKDKEKALSWLAKESLKLHEAGTHAMRGANGEKSGLEQLRFGLAGYETGEEGVATFTQQVLSGDKEIAGFDGYFAVGLARGVDGKEKRGFVKTFEILRDYYILTGSSEQKAKDKAWNRCIRTFRGVKNLNDVEGYCFTKDIVYREGNMAIWKVVNEVQKKFGTPFTKKFIETFYLGKWDPSNPKHYEVITRIKIISKEQSDVLNQVYTQILKKS